MKTIKIQLEKTPNGEIPFPYFIHEDGKVGVQKHWDGTPFELIGFAHKPEVGEMDINSGDFWFHPEQAVGMYPVFSTKKGKLYTQKDKVQVIEKVDTEKWKKQIN